MEGKPQPRVFDLMSIGIASALMIGIGLGAGLGFDAWLHSSPVGTLVGLAVGIAAAVASTVRQIRRYL
ncbi:MAG: AtpZ/AtpI family protein [Acidimicrobiales bacterium]|jgi:F0F1-type ATP synthase assembly protein I